MAWLLDIFVCHCLFLGERYINLSPAGRLRTNEKHFHLLILELTERKGPKEARKSKVIYAIAFYCLRWGTMRRAHKHTKAAKTKDSKAR